MKIIYVFKLQYILLFFANCLLPVDSLNYIGVQWADIIGIGNDTINPELESYIVESGKPLLGLQDEDCLVDAHQDFYDKVLSENGVLAS